MADLTSFVLKPAHGAMGNGILVIRERDGARFRLAGGRSLALDDLVYHAAGVISGLYALAGQTDAAIVEERLLVHPDFAAIASEGVPDVRVIVYRGVPVMAMTRLPTLRAGGRANLHQGAVAAGIDLESGRTTHAVLQSRPIREHPDTGEALLGREIPGFVDVLGFALRAADETGLGYVGADLVVDARHGPVLLEMNARPGLMIQLANRAGLLPRLRAVDREIAPDRSVGGAHRARRRDRAANPGVGMRRRLAALAIASACVLATPRRRSGAGAGRLELRRPLRGAHRSHREDGARRAARGRSRERVPLAALPRRSRSASSRSAATATW